MCYGTYGAVLIYRDGICGAVLMSGTVLIYGAVLMCIVCRRHHGAVVAVGLGSMGQCCVGQ